MRRANYYIKQLDHTDYGIHILRHLCIYNLYPMHDIWTLAYENPTSNEHAQPG